MTPERTVLLLYGSGRGLPGWPAAKANGRGVCTFRPVYGYRRSRCS